MLNQTDWIIIMCVRWMSAWFLFRLTSQMNRSVVCRSRRGATVTHVELIQGARVCALPCLDGWLWWIKLRVVAPFFVYLIIFFYLWITVFFIFPSWIPVWCDITVNIFVLFVYWNFCFSIVVVADAILSLFFPYQCIYLVVHLLIWLEQKQHERNCHDCHSSNKTIGHDRIFWIISMRRG